VDLDIYSPMIMDELYWILGLSDRLAMWLVTGIRNMMLDL